MVRIGLLVVGLVLATPALAQWHGGWHGGWGGHPGWGGHWHGGYGFPLPVPVPEPEYVEPPDPCVSHWSVHRHVWVKVCPEY